MAKATKSKALPPKSASSLGALPLRRAMMHMTAALMLIAAAFVGLFFDRQYVDRSIASPKSAPTVVLKNRPVWMTDFLAEQIARCAQPATTHSVFDHQLLVTTGDLLKANPWIRQVKQVRRAYGKSPGDILEIDCDYRAPIALVHWKDYYWLVDGDGVKLPEPFDHSTLGRIMFGPDHHVNIRVIEGVAQAPPESGAKWSGEDLKAALDLVKLLYDKPYAQEIMRVDCSNFAGRIDHKEAQLVMITGRNSQVRWGRPISSGNDDFFVEVPPARKLQYMEEIVAEHKHVDANFPWIDLRFDRVACPSVGTPQTANAEIAQ
jgi:hypothetical protein